MIDSAHLITFKKWLWRILHPISYAQAHWHIGQLHDTMWLIKDDERAKRDWSRRREQVNGKVAG